MFVAEDGGNTSCGLHAWQHNSRLAHATAPSALGPYQRRDIAVTRESQGPEVHRINGSWYLLHTGVGEMATPPVQCTPDGPDKPPPLPAVEPTVEAGGSLLQRATSPGGPWTPVENSPRCNNPAAAVSQTDGYIYLLCHNGGSLQIQRAATPEGPWSAAIPLNITGKPADHVWEDPVMYEDQRGNWHIICHSWNNKPWPSNTISGHAFAARPLSDDLTQSDWRSLAAEPFDNVVHFTDGSSKRFATLERPKLIFSAAGVPSHLISAACPAWDFDGAWATPCAQCQTAGGPGLFKNGTRKTEEPFGAVPHPLTPTCTQTTSIRRLLT